MRLLGMLLLLVSAALADLGGLGQTRCGNMFVVYSNTDTAAPITFDFSFWIQNASCGATATWTDAAGIPFNRTGNSEPFPSAVVVSRRMAGI